MRIVCYFGILFRVDRRFEIWVFLFFSFLKLELWFVIIKFVDLWGCLFIFSISKMFKFWIIFRSNF